MIGQGYRDKALSEAEIAQLLQALEVKELAGKRVLVIIPDGTRTAPVALFFRLLYEHLGPHVKRLDYLIALGTHQPMTDAAIAKLVGAGREERALRYPKSEVSNHRWELPETLIPIGTIPAAEMNALTGGLVARETVITINRMIFDYDALILGPVFPHEVVGFSGGAKYLFPGISGREIIDASHWTGALATSYATIGVNYRDDANRPRFAAPQLLGVVPLLPQRLLLVDDVSVSGQTLALAKQALGDRTVYTLVLKGHADIVLFPEIQSCVAWPWQGEHKVRPA